VSGIDLVSLRGTIPVTAKRASAGPNQSEGINATEKDGFRLRTLAQKDPTPSFKDMLAQALDTVNNLQINADRMAQKLATGEAKDIHEVLMAVEEVNIGLQLTMQIRNKIIEAYQEIMRMQV
jgi:flagellar hook-basal body complex protein FliE